MCPNELDKVKPLEKGLAYNFLSYFGKVSKNIVGNIDPSSYFYCGRYMRERVIERVSELNQKLKHRW